jgi:hypothetical protein
MNDGTHRWADELRQGVEVVKTMRDELKVQLHIGRMEARTRIERLEHRLDSEQLTLRKNMRELIHDLRRIVTGRRARS